jgi:two-component system CheB/CheR fusion protein
MSDAAATSTRQLAIRYGGSVAAVVLALALRLSLEATIAPGLPAYITFYPVVMLIALFWGVGPGLVATVATALVAGYWILPPAGMAIDSATDRVGLVFFAATCVLLCTVAGLHRRTRDRMAAVEHELALRESQEALRQSEAQLRAVFESLAEGVVVSDLSGNLLFWNRAALLAHGLTSQEEGRRHLPTLSDSFELATDDGATLAVDQWPLSRILRGKTLRECEFRVRRLDGRVPPKVFSYSGGLAYDAGGRPLLAVVTMTDVTERKRSEQARQESEMRLARAQEIAHLGSWQLDLPDNSLTWSDEVYRIFGLAPQQFGATYEAFLDGVHPDDRASVDAAYSASLRDGKDAYEIEHRVVRAATGEVRWVHEKCAHIRDADGRVVRSIGMVLDITERRQAEQAAQGAIVDLEAARISAERAKSAAEQATLAKDHFLAVLSHELRTPLTPVLTGLSLVEMEPALSERGRNCLDVIRRNVELEARLIDDLLDLTRIARGRIELDRHCVDLASIVDRAVEVCRPDIEARRLHFGVKYNPPRAYVVDGDAARLQQVVWNLLKNSTKFTPKGGCVGLECRAENGFAVLEVVDTGIGIEAAALPRIFDAFTQADPSFARQYGGLGLGLAITKALVEVHGGTIEALSAGREQGSTFRVRLPLVEVEARGAAVASPPVGAAAARRRLRVLLVEDHGDTLDMMVAVIDLAGHQVQTAGDVATALEMAAQGEFDLLVSDLGLPDRSGLDLMRELRSRGSVLPGIALSGYGQEADVRMSRAAGFAAHLVKPVDAEVLLAAMEDVVRGRRA